MSKRKNMWPENEPTKYEEVLRETDETYWVVDLTNSGELTILAGVYTIEKEILPKGVVGYRDERYVLKDIRVVKTNDSAVIPCEGGYRFFSYDYTVSDLVLQPNERQIPNVSDDMSAILAFELLESSFKCCKSTQGNINIKI